MSRTAWLFRNKLALHSDLCALLKRLLASGFMSLSAPVGLVAELFRSRTANPFGKSAAELAQVMEPLETVEPPLSRVAGHEIDTSRSSDEVVAQCV